MQPQLIVRQRTLQHGLSVALDRHLASARHLIDPQRLADTVPRWADVNAAVIDRYARASSVLAGRFYLAERTAAGVAGRFTVRLAAPPPQDQIKASLSYAASSLYGKPEPGVFDTVLSGVAQRLMLNTGRQTVLRSVHMDLRATGWSREVEPDACEFCEMLAGRGSVYRSEETAEFQAHDHCECLAVPEF